MKALCLVLAVSTILLLTSCRTTPEGRLPSGTVDLPQPNQVLKGPQVFFGWAISEDSVKAVKMYVDREFVAYAKYGVSRPDVNKLLPGFPSGDNAGWRLEFNAQDLPVGSHQIVFLAKTGSGAVGCIGERLVTIVH